jgi:hypothetical protein
MGNNSSTLTIRRSLLQVQAKVLRMIVDAPWYVPNTLIRRDLQIPSVKVEISHYSSHYSARLTAHPNDILLTFLEQPERKRLRDATCQTIRQLDLWCDLCNHNLTLGVASCCASIQLVPRDAVNRNKVSIRQLSLFYFFFLTHYMFRPLRAILR